MLPIASSSRHNFDHLVILILRFTRGFLQSETNLTSPRLYDYKFTSLLSSSHRLIIAFQRTTKDLHSTKFESFDKKKSNENYLPHFLILFDFAYKFYNSFLYIYRRHLYCCLFKTNLRIKILGPPYCDRHLQKTSKNVLFVSINLSTSSVLLPLQSEFDNTNSWSAILWPPFAKNVENPRIFLFLCAYLRKY